MNQSESALGCIESQLAKHHQDFQNQFAILLEDLIESDISTLCESGTCASLVSLDNSR